MKASAKLIRSLDGTRYYSPSSNQVNLQNSGPYKYMDPTLYYTTLNHGFSVETRHSVLLNPRSIQGFGCAARSVADQRRLGLSRLAPERERRYGSLHGADAV